jgi:hypothetical protein
MTSDLGVGQWEPSTSWPLTYIAIYVQTLILLFLSQESILDPEAGVISGLFLAELYYLFIYII